MRFIAILAALLLTACNEGYPILSYDELGKFPANCANATHQLKHLKYIESVKNFNPDPDALNEADRAYNGRLKATIWWYAYSCDKS